MAKLMTVTIDVKNLDEVKEYLDKYKWHNLTENPEDLPSERCKVLGANCRYDGTMYYDTVHFATDLYEVDEYDFAKYKGTDGFYVYDSTWGYCIVEVDAWKYIEPFEVDGMPFEEEVT